jgi:hypothetical protein
VLTAQATSNTVWFVCEPLDFSFTNSDAGGEPDDRSLVLEDVQNPEAFPVTLDVTGGSRVVSSPLQVCKDGAAGCTLIGNNVQVIVFTQKTLQRGDSNFGPGSQANVLGFLNAGVLRTGVTMDQLTQGSLLSFYMTHELFHTLSTPENMAVAGMFTNVASW